MSKEIDDLLNGSAGDLINKIVDNAKNDAVETVKELPKLGFNTNDNSFGAEEIESEEVEESEEVKNGAYDHLEETEETSSTATIQQNKFDDAPDTISELSEVDKKRNFLYCQLYVLMVTEGSVMAFKLLAGDWTEEGDKKYSLSKAKQNEIAKAWAEILNLELATKSPKSALTMLFVSSLLPMLFMALKSRVAVQRDKKDAKKKEETKQYRSDVSEAHKEIIAETIPVKEFVPNKGFYMPLENVAKIKPVEEIPPIQNFKIIDDKGTAEVAVIEKKIPLNKPAEKLMKRGRKKGSAKNPRTKKMEAPTHIENIEGVKYYAYSWGIKKKVK